MPINVRNVSRTPFVLNLLRGGTYDGHPACQPSLMKFAQAVDLPDGSSGVKHVKKSLPASLTWLPGEKKKGLPPQLQQIDQFKRAVLDHVLVVIETTEDTDDDAEDANVEGDSQ